MPITRGKEMGVVVGETFGEEDKTDRIYRAKKEIWSPCNGLH